MKDLDKGMIVGLFMGIFAGIVMGMYIITIMGATNNVNKVASGLITGLCCEKGNLNITCTDTLYDFETDTCRATMTIADYAGLSSVAADNYRIHPVHNCSIGG